MSFDPSVGPARSDVVPWPGDRPGGPADGLTDDEVRRLTAESRAAQGLPPTVQDPSTVERVVAVLRAEWGDTR